MPMELTGHFSVFLDLRRETTFSIYISSIFVFLYNEQETILNFYRELYNSENCSIGTLIIS